MIHWKIRTMVQSTTCWPCCIGSVAMQKGQNMMELKRKRRGPGTLGSVRGEADSHGMVMRLNWSFSGHAHDLCVTLHQPTL